jgi:hypothetical protein
MSQYRMSLVLAAGLGVAGVGCGDDGTDQPAGSAGAPSSFFVAVPIGPLAAADLAASKAAHDAIAQAGEEPAKQAGDDMHAVFLGTTLLGTTENEFAAVDRWKSDENMDAFYGNADFQQAFGQLFSAQPFFGTYECSDDWYAWGGLDAGKGAERWIVIVRGRLKGTDLEQSRQAHNAVASGGESTAKAAGDIAHVACIDRKDRRNFLAIDLWSAPEGIEGLYTHPDFAAAFGALFETAPSLGIYASTDWHQW